MSSKERGIMQQTYNENLEKFGEKISPTNKTIKEADKIFQEIVLILKNAEIIRNDTDVIKQGSYKNKTLTITKLNPKIDLDILIEGEYSNSNGTRSAIYNSLTARGFKCESKSRVIKATKNNFSVDILPVVVNKSESEFNKKFLIKEKGSQKQKTIDPIGMNKWSNGKKNTIHFSLLSKEEIKRNIDKETYNQQISKNEINIAIKILKAIGYDFASKHPEHKISSYEIETLCVDAYNGEITIKEIIGNALRRILKFGEEGTNFKNPNYHKENIIIFNGKNKYTKFCEYAQKELEKFSKTRRKKEITIAGVSMTIAALASSTLSFSGGASAFPPTHGGDHKSKLAILNERRKIRLQARKLNGKKIKIISDSHKEYLFELVNFKNKLSIRSLSPLSEKVHTYGNGTEICLYEFWNNYSKKQLEDLLRNWVDSYETYIALGFWGFDESTHKKERKEVSCLS